MAINGVGTDIVEIERVRRAILSNRRFAERVYTADELKLCAGCEASFNRMAGRFAAKEAVGKALGRSLSWHDVEILSDDFGAPVVILHGQARTIVGDGHVRVSISHCKDYATAVAVYEAD